MKWFIKVFRQYADFEGRSSRKEFWMFVLFNALFSLAWGIIVTLFWALLKDSLYFTTDDNGVLFVYKLVILYSCVMFVPSIAVGIRRLHDTGRSGWWMLISLIPIIGIIWLPVLMLLGSNPGPNAYGNPPESADKEKKPLEQKLLIGVISFAIFNIFLTLINLLNVLIFLDLTVKNVVLTLLKGGFLTPLALAIMGIVFLQKKDLLRMAGVWLIAAYMLEFFFIINEMSALATEGLGFDLNINKILFFIYILAFIFYGVLLFMGKKESPLANYVLMLGSGSLVIRYLLWFPLIFKFERLDASFYLSQLLLIMPLLLFIYAFINLRSIPKGPGSNE